MADNLIFPIKFDLEAAVREAQGDADRLLRRLQTTINAKPLAVNLKIPGAGSGSINEINSRLKELVRQWNNLTEAQRITNKAAGEYTAEAKRILDEYTRLRGASESYAQSLKQIDAAAKKAAKQQEKLAEAAYRGSNAFRNQEGYVSRLVKRLAVYASFQYTSQFLTNIREVTAQFELQRISLGAIIQDQQKANQIFAEIKSFALTSPLKILDLTKYAKQVAAYGFAADRVFDVTKRLADISVGLGVDMGRLTLAVSQIKAATVLKSSELRQLTETGLPMLDLLSKKLTETQGKLVSAADVMDLISKRAISYEMVEEILYDLTDAGGMFYNMQIKQSQTLFGMWSKLGDAAAIMYDQIGNTSSINAGMKLAIQSIESMMRNWKTTARVLDSVAVAMTVYIVGLKNAAVASKALTSAVALENLAHQQQIIRTPKVIARIIGLNNAKKISTLLTNLHTKAVLSEAAATNVLTKSFWRLTAAILANPWVAAASAIALVGVALFHFIGNTETAAERAEKLNNSVASLKSLTTEVEPLIDTYKELADKTERTADEQKKLNKVAIELAQKFPAAITVIKEYGQEMGLAADELARLYENMKRMKTEDVQQELTENEDAVDKLIQRRQQLQTYFDEGKMWSGGGGTGGGGGAMVAMSEEEKRRVTALITDIDKQILELNESIINAKRELGELPSEVTQAIEGFGAWKKKLTEFSKDVGGINVKLFDDSTINQFGTLEAALDAAAKKYKEATESVETYNKTLKQGVAGLGQEQFDRIAAERDEAQAMKELSEEALNYYNAMALLLKVMGSGRQSDQRLQILNEMVQLAEKLNKEYSDWEKKVGSTQALEKVNATYAETVKYAEQVAKDAGISLPHLKTPTNAKELNEYLEAVRKVMETAKGLKGGKKAAIELAVKMSNNVSAEDQKAIEEKIKALADRISRTKTAKEFYEKILSQTGDVELAASLSLNIFGENGEDLNKNIRKRIEAIVEDTSATLPAMVFRADNSVDTKALREWAEANEQALGQGGDAYKELIKIANDGEKDVVKMIDGWIKATEKAKTYSDKLEGVSRKTANSIGEIERQKGYAQVVLANLLEVKNPTKEQQGRIEALRDLLGFYSDLIPGFLRKEADEMAKLQYEAFKDSPMYVQMFDDLDNASSTMLRNMKQRIEELQGEWKNLDPTQLKEMQSRLNEIDEQLAKRNPFKGLIDGIKDYRKLRTIGDDLGNTSRKDADKALADAEERRLKAEKEYRSLLADPTATETQRKVAKSELDAAETREKVAAKAVENWKKVEDAIGLSANELFKMLNWAGDIAKGIADISEAMGADKEDVQYWNDVADALGQISGGIQDIVSAAMSGNVVGIISSVITAIPKMFVGFANLFSAGKIKRANKEIERQAELLERLEYTYGRLEKAAEKAFGVDYLRNYNAQLRNLRAQQQAYQKQAEAERSKGKKEDEEATRDYLDKARDAADQIADMQDELMAHFAGSTRADVARQMAQSWIEARASMSDTFAAIKGDYQNMVKNMLIEGAAARVIENALAPLWQRIEDAYKSSDPSKALDEAMRGMDVFLNNANEGMEVLWKAFEARGYDMKKLLGDTDTSLTGISRDIASASEESINGLATGIHTQNFYISQQLEEVRAIRRLLEGGVSPSNFNNGGGIDYTALGNQALNHLAMIERYTGETAARCERAAVACESQVAMLRRVIVPKGSSASHSIQVELK